MTAIVCIGEQRAEREAGKTLQMSAVSSTARSPDGATAANLVIAYEPVWAIGTGLTPTAADVAEVHAFIRKRLSDRFSAAGGSVRILLWRFGQAGQRKELLTIPNVNGALVGGASLKATDFLGIAAIYR